MCNPVLDVFQRHFPDVAFEEHANLFWNELTLTYDRRIQAVDVKKNRYLLSEIEKSLKNLAVNVSQLSPDIFDELERVHKLNAFDRLDWAPRSATRDRLIGKERDIEVVVSANELIRRLHVGLTGEWPLEPGGTKERQLDAFDLARKKLDNVISENTQERKHGSWRKVVLVQRAREAWRRYKGEAPPNTLNPASEFGNFLHELIEALGENWDVQSTFNAWMHRQDKLA